MEEVRADDASSREYQHNIVERRSAVEQLILDQLKTLRQEQRHGFESMRAEFNSRIDRLVTAEAFVAEQRRVDDRVVEINEAVRREREARTFAIKDMQARGDKLAANLRWVAGGVLLPIGIVIFNATQGGGA